MSAQTDDLLARTVPLRLHRADEDWVLELEHLVRVSAALYRPRTLEVTGEGPILRWLARGHEELSSEAERVMRELAQGSFSFVDGFLEHESSPPVDAADPADQIQWLKGEVRSLRAAHRSMSEQLGSVQARHTLHNTHKRVACIHAIRCHCTLLCAGGDANV